MLNRRSRDVLEVQGPALLFKELAQTSPCDTGRQFALLEEISNAVLFMQSGLEFNVNLTVAIKALTQTLTATENDNVILLACRATVNVMNVLPGAGAIALKMDVLRSMLTFLVNSEAMPEVAEEVLKALELLGAVDPWAVLGYEECLPALSAAFGFCSNLRRSAGNVLNIICRSITSVPAPQGNGDAVVQTLGRLAADLIRGALSGPRDATAREMLSHGCLCLAYLLERRSMLCNAPACAAMLLQMGAVDPLLAALAPLIESTTAEDSCMVDLIVKLLGKFAAVVPAMVLRLLSAKLVQGTQSLFVLLMNSLEKENRGGVDYSKMLKNPFGETRPQTNKSSAKQHMYMSANYTQSLLHLFQCLLPEHVAQYSFPVHGWLWETDVNTYEIYDPLCCEQLEKAYRNRHTDVQLTIKRMPYSVNLPSMRQLNHEGRPRAVMRQALPVHYKTALQHGEDWGHDTDAARDADLRELYSAEKGRVEDVFLNLVPSIFKVYTSTSEAAARVWCLDLLYRASLLLQTQCASNPAASSRGKKKKKKGAAEPKATPIVDSEILSLVSGKAILISNMLADSLRRSEGPIATELAVMTVGLLAEYSPALVSMFQRNGLHGLLQGCAVRSALGLRKIVALLAAKDEGEERDWSEYGKALRHMIEVLRGCSGALSAEDLEAMLMRLSAAEGVGSVPQEVEVINSNFLVSLADYICSPDVELCKQRVSEFGKALVTMQSSGRHGPVLYVLSALQAHVSCVEQLPIFAESFHQPEATKVVLRAPPSAHEFCQKTQNIQIRFCLADRSSPLASSAPGKAERGSKKARKSSSSEKQEYTYVSMDPMATLSQLERYFHTTTTQSGTSSKPIRSIEKALAVLGMRTSLHRPPPPPPYGHHSHIEITGYDAGEDDEEVSLEDTAEDGETYNQFQSEDDDDDGDDEGYQTYYGHGPREQAAKTVSLSEGVRRSKYNLWMKGVGFLPLRMTALEAAVLCLLSHLDSTMQVDDDADGNATRGLLQEVDRMLTKGATTQATLGARSVPCQLGLEKHTFTVFFTGGMEPLEVLPSAKVNLCTRLAKHLTGIAPVQQAAVIGALSDGQCEMMGNYTSLLAASSCSAQPRWDIGLGTGAVLLRLLRVIHALLEPALHDPTSSLFGRHAEFQNPKVAAKVMKALLDNAVGAAALGMLGLPGWCRVLPRTMPFLFPLEVRRLYFKFLASSALKDFYTYSQQHRVAPVADIVADTGLSSVKVAVARENVMDEMDNLLNQLCDKRVPFEIMFSGEAGTGTGPTVECFTIAGHEIQRKGNGIWRGDSPAGATGPLWAPSLSGDDHMFTEEGVFPSPDEAGNKNRKEKLITIGRFIGKSLHDSILVDIHVSHALFAVLCMYKGLAEIPAGVPPFTVSGLAQVDKGLGASMAHLLELAANGDEASRKEVNEMELYFLPTPKDPHRKVTMDSLREFVNETAKYFMFDSVKESVSAILQGLEEVIPSSLLNIFTPSEIDSLLSGSSTDGPLWSYEELRKAINADHGYTSESPEIALLAEVLCEMEPAEQRKFLAFLTGSPRLPIGGVRAIEPRITVVRKGDSFAMSYSPVTATPELTFQKNDLPTCNTCFHYLKLPSYPNKEVMISKLRLAINEGLYQFSLS